MGQKINPIGFRLSVNKNWSARWFANSRNFSRLLLEDIKVREYLTKKLAHASLGHIRIERPTKNARVTLYSARPGMIIGKKGEDIEVLRTALQKIAGVPVQVNIEDIRKPELDAQLIAASIANQLERRIMFRRAMKRAMQNAMKLGGLGIKIMSAGRLNGAEIARTEWYREGRVPLHTLRADIEYGFAEAKTTYGVIGIKVWVYKGETPALGEQVQSALPEATAAPDVTRQEFVRSIMGAEATPAAEPEVKTVRRKITPQVGMAEPAAGTADVKKKPTTAKPAPGKRPAPVGAAAKDGARPKRTAPRPAAGHTAKAPAKKPAAPKAKKPTDEKS